MVIYFNSDIMLCNSDFLEKLKAFSTFSQR